MMTKMGISSPIQQQNKKKLEKTKLSADKTQNKQQVVQLTPRLDDDVGVVSRAA